MKRSYSTLLGTILILLTQAAPALAWELQCKPPGNGASFLHADYRFSLANPSTSLIVKAGKIDLEHAADSIGGGLFNWGMEWNSETSSSARINGQKTGLSYEFVFSFPNGKPSDGREFPARIQMRVMNGFQLLEETVDANCTYKSRYRN